MNQRPKKHIDDIIKKLTTRLDKIKEILPKFKVHFEMGAFTDPDLFKTVILYEK